MVTNPMGVGWVRITTITPRMVALEVVGAQRQPNLTKVNQLVPTKNW
jgi:hypothetical protein